MKAEIITIGDEILIGQIVDTNSAWIATQFNLLGIRISQITSISDNREHILNTLNRSLNENDVVLVTGGLGPTRDDITKQTLCELFETDLVEDAEALKNVLEIFSKRGMPLLETNRQQALLPRSCQPLYNSCGTAPGMWFEKNGKVLISMPGVPYEMKAMMEMEVIPRLKKSFSFPYIFHRTLLTSGVGESFLAEKIRDIEDQLPSNIKLAYLPSPGQVRLRLSGSGSNPKEVENQVNMFIDALKIRLGDDIFGEGDTTLAHELVRLLIEKNLSLSLAESCTGGYISHLITQVPGCSKVFAGSVVSYSYDMKEEFLGVNHDTLTTYGAVSKQTVNEMLTGCFNRFKTDCALAVSGIAGPEGGTPEKPVGTVYIGFAYGEKKHVQRFSFENSRSRNTERTALMAMNLLRKLIN